MKSLFEISDTINTITEREDDILRRCEAYIESSYNEYLHEIENIELQMMTESNTSFSYQVILENNAGATFLDKVKAVLTKIKDTIVNVCKAVVAKISSFFGSKSVQDAAKEAEKQAKTNPDLKNKKIEIPDVDRRSMENQKDLDEVRKIQARQRSGKFTPEDEAKLKEIKAKRAKKKAIIGGGVVSVALVTAIGMAFWHKKRSTEQLNDLVKEGASKEIKLADPDAPEKASKLIDSERLKAEIANDIAREAGESINIFQKVKNTIKSAVSRVKNGPTYIVDIDAIDRADRDATKESADDMLDTIISNVDTHFKGRSTAEKYLDLMEAEIFGLDEPDGLTAEEYLEEMNEDLFTDVPNYNRVQSEKLAESLHI